MRIAIVNTKRTVRARYMLDCFATGAATHGDRCVWIEGTHHIDRLKNVDLGVFVCLPNFHHDADPINGFRIRVWETLKKLGKRALVIDTGFVRNQYDYETLCRLDPRSYRFDTAKANTFPAADAKIYYELAFEGIKGLGDHATDGKESGDRWKVLKAQLKPWRNGSGHIALLTQPLHGQSSQGKSVFDWYAEVFKEMRELGCTLPIVARAHPRVDRRKAANKHEYRKTVESLLGKGQSISWSDSLRIGDILKDASIAVAYSTSAAVDAVCAGVPLLVGSNSCVAAPVASRTLGDVLHRIKHDKHPAREQWAYALAYSQWNCAELRTGRVWRHYKKPSLLPRKGFYA